MARILRSLLALIAALLGVQLLLFAILEVGVLGDPALRRAGRNPSLHGLGEARLRLGQLSDWRPRAVQLTLPDGGEPWFLEAAGKTLRLARGDGRTVAAAPVAGASLRSIWSELGAPAAWRVAAASDAAELPAAGLLAAIGDQRARLEPGQSTWLPWAEAVPLWRRFAAQTLPLLRGDFGRSLDGQSIAAQLWRRGGRSLALTAPAFFLTTAVALLLAGVAAWRRGAVDRILTGGAVLSMSVSSLVYILFLQRWLAGRLDLFPVFGWRPPYLLYLALPVLIWLIAGWGYEFRFYRALVVELAGSAPLRTARAKGLSRRAVALRHLLPQLALQVITRISGAVPFLVLGSLLLERYFGIPGLGNWSVQAVLDGDLAVLRAVTLVAALLYLVALRLADFLNARVDPRLDGESGR